MTRLARVLMMVAAVALLSTASADVVSNCFEIVSYGVNQHVDFGTPFEHIEEYGYSMLCDDEKFRLGISDLRDIERRIHDPLRPERGSTFFSFEIKDFSH